MQGFPLTPELMQAFPIGAMPSLLALVSALSAQHGPQNVRRVCIELAANDDLWTFVETGLGNLAAGDALPKTESAAAAAYDALASNVVTEGTSGTNGTNGAGPPPPTTKKKRTRKDRNGIDP